MTEEKDQNEEAEARGWQAIDAALEPLYGEQEPLHWGTLINYRLGGKDPLDGISAYRSSDSFPHWHLVTYGFSELYEKEDDDPEVSGYGFELTFRLARAEGEEEPPMWSLNFLQNLARYVFQSGNAFEPGHHMHLNGPIALESETQIEAIAFARDPDLPPIATPNGRLEFLQIVGLTTDEYLSILRWNCSSALELVGSHLPRFVCDLGRSSLLDVSDFREALEEGCARDGSSTNLLFTNHASWTEKTTASGRQITVTIDVAAARRINLVLPGRIPYGHSLSLLSDEGVISFEASESAFARVDEDEVLVVGLTTALARDLVENLSGGSGDYEIAGIENLAIHVKPTVIRDQEGNVVETIE